MRENKSLQKRLQLNIFREKKTFGMHISAQSIIQPARQKRRNKAEGDTTIYDFEKGNRKS